MTNGLMTNALSLRFKLVGGFSVVALLALLVGVVGLMGATSLLTTQAAAVYASTLARDLVMRELDHMRWRQKIGNFQRDERMVVLDVEKDATRCPLGQWLQTDARREAEARVARLGPLLRGIEDPHRRLHQSAVRIEKLLQEGQRAQAIKVYGTEVTASLEELQRSFGALSEVLVEYRDVIEQKAAATATHTKLVVGVSTAAAFVVALLFGVSLALSITRPVTKIAEAARRIAAGDIKQLVDHRSQDEIGVLAEAFRELTAYIHEVASALHQLSQGDLTVRVKPRSPNDTIGCALEETFRSLGALLARVKSSAGEVAGGAQQVSAASQALSQGATEQAASLEQISSSMAEIGSKVKGNADHATLANALALTARKAAEGGKHRVEATLQAMAEIHDANVQVGRIAKLIDEIAFQTSLLALNAAVEAARANQAGKGFAVVAEEVKTLANRSAAFAAETASLIEASVKKAETGLTVARDTAGSFEQIMVAVVKAADIVGEIAGSSNEQAHGVAEISTALHQVEQVMQANTAHNEESASAAEQLSAEAQQLEAILRQFELDGGPASPKVVHASLPRAPNAMRYLPSGYPSRVG